MPDKPQVAAKRPFFSEGDFTPCADSNCKDCAGAKALSPAQAQAVANEGVEPLLESIEMYLNETEPYIEKLENTLVVAMAFIQKVSVTSGSPAEIARLRDQAFDVTSDIDELLPDFDADEDFPPNPKDSQ